MFMPQYNGLTRFDPWVGFDSIVPDLAKSCEFSSDFLHLTLRLTTAKLLWFQDSEISFADCGIIWGSGSVL